MGCFPFVSHFVLFVNRIMMDVYLMLYNVNVQNQEMHIHTGTNTDLHNNALCIMATDLFRYKAENNA